MYRFFMLLAIVAYLPFTLGCGITAQQEWSENYVLMEGVRATSPQMIDGNIRTYGEAAFPEGSQGTYGMSPASEAIVTLPEKKVVRRIVIHWENLKEFDVFADKGDGDWRVMKEVNSVKTNPIDLSLPVSFPTDKIRIRVLGTTDDSELRRTRRSNNPGGRFSGNARAAGKIKEIELYGYKSTEEVIEEKEETSRENELDELLKLN